MRSVVDAPITAEKAIAATTALAGLLARPDLIAHSPERREAVLSSRIECTRTDLTQLLDYEATGSAEDQHDTPITLANTNRTGY